MQVDANSKSQGGSLAGKNRVCRNPVGEAFALLAADGSLAGKNRVCRNGPGGTEAAGAGWAANL